MITLRKLFTAFVLIQAFAAAILAQTPETNSNNKSGVISGIVTSSSGDLPSNTTVFASALGANVPAHSVVINSDGAFRIENLEAGAYRVWAGAPGFVIDPQNVTSDTRAIYHTGDSVTLRLRKGGVITGRVLKSNNTPVVAASVRAFRIRDENGKPMDASAVFGERMTDDRGVYRMYGLMPGTYIVSAGGMPRFFGGYGTTGYDQDTPTYSPSATRDTAQEVVVRSGEEATADISYRGEPGHAISGTVVGIPPAQGGMSYGGTVNLTDVKTRTSLMGAQASSFTNHVFVFYGLPDGEYELVATQFSQTTRDTRASEPKRIKVQGADVTGVNLTVAPLPAITGRVILDSTSSADCVKHRATAFQETVVNVRRQKRPAKSGAPEDALAEAVPLNSLEQMAEDVPDAKGDFILRNLRAGIYRVGMQPPSAAWYVRSITLGANTKGTDWKVISDGVSVKQSVSGLTVTISEGAAGIRGRLTVPEGQRLPARAIVYLVPAEKENATNLLRYFEGRVESDGTFNLRHVAPGDYLIHARAVEETPTMISIREDSEFRTAITREAEKAKQSVTLKACERLENYEFLYPPTTKP